MPNITIVSCPQCTMPYPFIYQHYQGCLCPQCDVDKLRDEPYAERDWADELHGFLSLYSTLPKWNLHIPPLPPEEE